MSNLWTTATDSPYSDRPISEVKTYEFSDGPTWEQARKQLSEANVEGLKQDISRNGLDDALWVDDTRTPPLVHDGHHRLEALDQLGHTHVPVRSYSLDERDEDWD
jgi:hypothetical protein